MADMPDFTDGEWFRGMAGAAYTLSLVTVERLVAAGEIARSEAETIMEEALAAAEAQPATVPGNERITMATRFHLERASESLRLFCEERGLF